MVSKYHCNVDKEDYLEIENVRKNIVFEVVNFSDDEGGLVSSLASLSKEQVKDLISKLNSLIEIIED